MNQSSFLNRQFWLLCFGSLLFMGSFNMIIPELPDFLSALGGENYKGLIISLFTLTAAFSRPFSGKLADMIGRKPIIIFGIVVAVVSSMSYLFLTSVAAFLWLRFFHGFSTGFSPTGQTALLSDMVPVNKRGEAMGIFGIASSLGMAGGPALGGYLANNYGMDAMFIVSSLSSLLAILIFLPMPETLVKPEKFKLKLLLIKPSDVFEPRVIGPAVVMVLYTFSFGAVLTLVPDFSEFLNVGNKGLYFTVYFLASLFSRIIAGKVSDKFGRVLVIKSGMILILLGLIITGWATTKFIFLLGAGFYGFGGGVASPTVFAWTVDLSSSENRGRGISTMFLALEIGIGLGALISGWIFNNQLENISLAFGLCAFLVISALIYLQVFWKSKNALTTGIEL